MSGGRDAIPAGAAAILDQFGVVLHELGHLLGLDHDDGVAVAPTPAPGERLVPDVGDVEPGAAETRALAAVWIAGWWRRELHATPSDDDQFPRS